MPSDSYVPTHNNKNILHKHFFLSHLKTALQISRSWLIFISISLKQRWDSKKTKCLFSSAAAASKLLQSCPTLCNPRDGSSPGSPVPGILQARTLEWVAISFPNAWKWKVKVKSLSRVWPSATPWTAAHQAPLSMGQARVLEWGAIAFSAVLAFTKNVSVFSLQN